MDSENFSLHSLHEDLGGPTLHATSRDPSSQLHNSVNSNDQSSASSSPSAQRYPAYTLPLRNYTRRIIEQPERARRSTIAQWIFLRVEAAQQRQVANIYPQDNTVRHLFRIHETQQNQLYYDSSVHTSLGSILAILDDTSGGRISYHGSAITGHDHFIDNDLPEQHPFLVIFVLPSSNALASGALNGLETTTFSRSVGTVFIIGSELNDDWSERLSSRAIYTQSDPNDFAPTMEDAESGSRSDLSHQFLGRYQNHLALRYRREITLGIVAVGIILGSAGPFMSIFPQSMPIRVIAGSLAFAANIVMVLKIIFDYYYPT
ncbi:hypothetical protein M422DRAFT_66648 [Sphaerobolus stellatus SS14]|uniref:Unplaced genomic scaffold SPHSTscaffold_30, whole genome shotgun sequence n=1 Tax=Sphaerobolus stellatus (strain SS14) TaxID=990650 RepID=A0A0C9W3S6_SPHS4|nr:hypothetical protein M422DRAFT_66648 [Sphaerobolus stellatus SS14]